MSVTCPVALDFTRLKTPQRNGEVLILPDPSAWPLAARANAEALGSADVPLLGSTLGKWRSKTRAEIVGDEDRPIIVIGHQPGFIHPGVWAKHIVAQRLAEAIGGVAINLVVDTDAPKATVLPIPRVTGDLATLETVRFADLPVGQAFEHIGLIHAEQLAAFERGVRQVMGEQFDQSQMPAFFAGMADAAEPRDWVDQAMAGRRAVETRFDVRVDDRRVSKCWNNPFLADLLANAQRFAGCYNAALAAYRSANRIRGSQRPIPDLQQTDKLLEVPFWAQRTTGARQRLFVAGDDQTVSLFAGETQIAEAPLAELRAGEDLDSFLNGWCLRPRALTLTIWARVFLADLFIHGIGGAKYDRISDTIIEEYYGIAGPYMACASATVRLNLPTHGSSWNTVRRFRRGIRELKYNPHRWFGSTRELGDLVERRRNAVQRAESLRKSEPSNRTARHRAFQEIRKINADFLAAVPGAMKNQQADLARAVDELQQDTIACGREYFFGLCERASLEQLTKALPAVRDFRV